MICRLSDALRVKAISSVSTPHCRAIRSRTPSRCGSSTDHMV